MKPTRATVSGPARALERWIESHSAFWRPVALGAAIILMLILARGGILVPLVLLVVVIASAHPLHELVMALLTFGLAILGGGLSGLAYSIVGRWLRPVPRVGPYLAGWVMVAPYVSILCLILRVIDSKPLFVRPEAAEYVPVALMIAVFGTQMGYLMFRRSITQSRPDSPVAG